VISMPSRIFGQVEAIIVGLKNVSMKRSIGPHRSN
jgi:hypothetical protein